MRTRMATVGSPTPQPLHWAGRTIALVVTICLIAAVMVTGPLYAQQNGRIVGRVTSAESGAPIAEVQVFLPGTGLGSLTRQNGAFVILQVPPGVHEVRAEQIGLARGVPAGDSGRR